MKKPFALLCALTMTLLACSCGSTQQTTLTTVRVNEVAHSVFYAPQYVAMKEGFFAEEGIDIQLTNGGGADKVMTAVLTAQADIGLAGPEA